MQHVLRVVNNRLRWSMEEVERAPWLQNGHFIADPLGDLRTKKGAFSVYAPPSDAQIDRVLIAVAASRQYPGNVDYVRFDPDILGDLSVRLVHSPLAGATPDDEVNTWHHDVSWVSAQVLPEVARRIIEYCFSDRKGEKEVTRLIVDAATNGRLNVSRMDPRLCAKLKIAKDGAG